MKIGCFRFGMLALPRSEDALTPLMDTSHNGLVDFQDLVRRSGAKKRRGIDAHEGDLLAGIGALILLL